MTRDPIIDRAEEDVKNMMKGKKEEEKKYEISLIETKTAIYEQASYDANDESEGKMVIKFLRYDKKTEEVETPKAE